MKNADHFHIDCSSCTTTRHCDGHTCSASPAARETYTAHDGLTLHTTTSTPEGTDTMSTTTENLTPTPAIRSVRKTGPCAWLVIFEDGLPFRMVGGYYDEAQVREEAAATRTKSRIREPHHKGCYTVAATYENGDFITVSEAGRFDCRDDAELAAHRLQRETGIEHGSFFGRAEDYHEA